jgi:hypothetical protein
MEKEIKDAIEKVIRFPFDYRIRGNMSPIALIKESGYPGLHSKINEEEIAAVLKLHPHMINEWLLWSENKRSNPTWHFMKFDDGSYQVEYSSEGRESEEIITLDEIKACAAFIKREMGNYKS